MALKAISRLLFFAVVATVVRGIDIESVLEQHNQTVHAMLVAQNMRFQNMRTQIARAQNLTNRILMTERDDETSNKSFDEPSDDYSDDSSDDSSNEVNDNVEACFQYIQQRQVQNLATYQHQISVCGKTASVARARVWAQANATRDALIRRGKENLNSLSNCKGPSDDIQFFTCYEQAARVNSENLNSISLDSNNQVDEISASLESVDFDQKKCSTEARNTVASTSMTIDSDMRTCILGAFKPPSTSTTESSEKSSLNSITSSPLNAA